MAIPQIADDGNFMAVRENGPADIAFPFADQGDMISFEYKPLLRADRRAFATVALALNAGGAKRQIISGFNWSNKSMSAIATPLGQAYLVDPGEAHHVGNGLYEWSPTYASIPLTRMVGGSIAYNLQLPDFSGSSPVVREFPATLSSQVLMEYGSTSFAPYKAMRFGTGIGGIIILLGNKVAFDLGGNDLFSPFSQPSIKVNATPIAAFPIPAGTFIAAQDSECQIYKGGIYSRKTILIAYPSFSQL